MAEAFLNPEFLQELDQFVSQNYVEDNTLIAKGPVEEAEEAEIYAKENQKSFIETLEEMREKYNKIGKENLDEVKLYKKANISRQTFYKLREKDRPSKDSAVSYALALELCENDMERLLASAGHSLAANNKRDWILRFCFIKKRYEYSDVCAILKATGHKMLKNL